MNKNYLSKLLYCFAIFAVLAFGNISSVKAQTAEADFQARCSAPGVTYCEGFDTLSSVQYSSSYPFGRGFFWNSTNPLPEHGNHVWDTNMKTSGTGAVKFSTPDPEFFKNGGVWDSAGVAGQIRVPMGRDFRSGDTFYLQWRMRFDQNMLNINKTNSAGGSGFKQIVVHNYSATCAQTELTFTNDGFQGFPTWYTACGARRVYIDISPFGNRVQQGDYSTCTSNNYSPSDCWYFRPDEWETFYWKVKIGTDGQPDSHLEAWAKRGDAPFEKIFDKSDMILTSSGPYNTISLTPYMNNRADTGEPTHPEAYVWYDEVIVSTQPIAAPANIPPTCSDGSQNGDETGVDCGGSCPACIKKYNLADFIGVAADWLSVGSGSPADVNLDNVVNSKDLGIMMSGWEG